MIYILNFADHIFYSAKSPDEAIQKVQDLIKQDNLEPEDFEIILLTDEDMGWKRFDFEDFCRKWG